MTQPTDPLRMLAALRSHGVTYVVVGGVARAALGGPIEIDDVDVCISSDRENLERMGRALQQLGAEPTGEQGTHRSTYDTSAGRLDVIEPGDSFGRLYEHASGTDLGNGIVAYIASREDEAELKRLSGDLAGAVRLSSSVETNEPTATDDRHEDEFGSTRPERDWPRWATRIWTAFEDVDDFLTRAFYGDAHSRS
jgi:hypothetical protein